jgi:Uma2 family endonuclease
MSQAAANVSEGRQTDLRQLAQRLLETQRVEYVDEGVLLVMNPPGFAHRRIVASIVRVLYACLPAGWFVYAGDFQWDLPDGSGRFYVPDVVVVPLGRGTAEQEKAAIALVAEVTSPTSPDTVLNDRQTKPGEYARAGIPLYLLADQEAGRWTLYALAEGWQRYQIAAGGKYGEDIGLPPPLGFTIPTGDWPPYQA